MASTPASVSARTKRLIVEGIKAKREAVNEWFCARSAELPPPFYCSVDLRDSGHKIVPVDSNLYPAGFNNLCPDDQRTAPAIFREQISRTLRKLGRPEPRRVLILPEAHTSNRYYIENLHYLRQILIDAGYEVGMGWIGELPEGTPLPIRLVSATDKELEAHPIRVEGGELRAGEFIPDVILLNNDFSSGYPKLLDGLRQPVLPSHTLGWHSRKKSEHFLHYNRLATEFARLIGIDPWHITVDTQEVAPVNFNEDQGIPEVADAVAAMLGRIQSGYDAHGVTGQKPFVFVKNNHGTYGMGIMVVHSADEVRAMNRRAKNKMSVGKNKLAIDSVAVQEGIPTATLVDRLAAEPVIYMAGDQLIGGFLRTNTERGAEENLNSQGMVFRKLCMLDLRRSGILGAGPDLDEEMVEEEPSLEIVYGAIARLSALATGAELSAHDPQGHGLLRGMPGRGCGERSGAVTA